MMALTTKSIVRLLALGAVLSLTSGCAMGDTTSEYGIYVTGLPEQAKLADVDEAWMLACALANVDPHEFAKRTILNVNLESEVIISHDAPEQGTRFGGLSYNGNDLCRERVYVPEGAALLDGNHVALVHEFYHTVLWLRDGDQDELHAQPGWNVADSNQVGFAGSK